MNPESAIVFENGDELNSNEINEFVANIKNGNYLLITNEHQALGNDVNFYGEKIIIEILYTCKLCSHCRKDKDDICNFTGLHHESICHLFDKIK